MSIGKLVDKLAEAKNRIAELEEEVKLKAETNQLLHEQKLSLVAENKRLREDLITTRGGLVADLVLARSITSEK